MGAFEISSLALVTAAALAWVNHRFVGLPTTIGVMLIALALSLGLHALNGVGFDLETPVEAVLAEVDFGDTLLNAMLAFLLFAGALHVKLGDLLGRRWIIGGLATVGVVVSTLVVAVLTRLLLRALGLDPGFLPCLLFGALISPTDPIAVLGILKSAGVPKSLETKITGESLFNDGIGVVVFSVLLTLAAPGAAGHGEHGLGALAVIELFAVEVVGALVLGAAAGALALWMLRSVDEHKLEVLITLALCCGVYSLAAAVHSSGPLAVVVAGLFVGNTGRVWAMSPSTAEHLDTFWELVDEILNVLLFVLIGMEVLMLRLDGSFLLAGALAIPIVLLARFLAVGGAVSLLARWRPFTAGAVPILTWAGLRGGISVALALQLPADLAGRDALLTMTYVVVIFSITVQGLTIAPLSRRLLRTAGTGAA